MAHSAGPKDGHADDGAGFLDAGVAKAVYGAGIETLLIGLDERFDDLALVQEGEIGVVEVVDIVALEAALDRLQLHLGVRPQHLLEAVLHHAEPDVVESLGHFGNVDQADVHGSPPFPG
jgi:hypothetical protein